MEEIWKDVPGFEGRYLASNMSNVKSLISNKILKPVISNNYRAIDLWDSTGKSRRYYVHRVVATTFIPNPEGKKLINHKDGNKSNNEVINLEWCTHSENIRHAYDNNLIDISIKKDRNKLNEEQVRTIKLLIKLGQRTLSDIAKEFKVTATMIGSIKRGTRWSHVL